MYVANTDGLCKPLVKKQAEFVLMEFELLRARGFYLSSAAGDISPSALK